MQMFSVAMVAVLDCDARFIRGASNLPTALTYARQLETLKRLVTATRSDRARGCCHILEQLLYMHVLV